MRDRVDKMSILPLFLLPPQFGASPHGQGPSREPPVRELHGSRWRLHARGGARPRQLERRPSLAVALAHGGRSAAELTTAAGARWPAHAGAVGDGGEGEVRKKRVIG
jgi:hypothetical protein